MAIEAVVFDIGNVLLEWHPERHFDRAIGADRRRALFEAVDLHSMNQKVDQGEPFRETVEACAEAHPEWHDEIMLWHDGWLQMAAPAIPQSVGLLRALRARDVPVFALSNFGAETFEMACAEYPFLREFDRSFISGRMQVIKPDPEIYRRVEADTGLAPETLLFADDSAKNIAAAAARGWQTHLFEGPEGWAARLVSERLLSEAEAQA